MKTHPNRYLITLALLGALTGSTSAQSIPFSDGFEGSSLDPFWVSTLGGGAVTFPSTVQQHGGGQSVELVVAGGPDNFVTLSHTFAGGAFGELSLWFYDSGQTTAGRFDFQIRSGNGLIGGLSSPEESDGFYSFYGQGLFVGQFSPVQRSVGWHHFSISWLPVLSGSFDLAIDGATYHQLPRDYGHLITEVEMRWQSQGGFPGGSVYIDDFAFTPVPVPEPTTWMLLGVGALALLVFNRARRNTAS